MDEHLNVVAGGKPDVDTVGQDEETDDEREKLMVNNHFEAIPFQATPCHEFLTQRSLGAAERGRQQIRGGGCRQNTTSPILICRSAVEAA